MKKNYNIWLWLLAICSIFASCKKDNTGSTSPQDLLPPATQTGANTFGCLINGKVWIPKGYTGTGTPNLHIIYSFDLNNKPYLFLETNQFINGASNSGVDITYRNIDHIGYYSSPDSLIFSVGSRPILGDCGISSTDSYTQVLGGGVITKLDIPNQIIAGTFAFKAKRPNCDTVFITDGRFDIKF